jgi:DNA-binding CsgD family transcriptional regulator
VLWSGDDFAGGGIEDTFFIARPPLEPLAASLFVLPSGNGPSAPRLLLILRDPHRCCALRWEAFRERFGLTPTELRLCLALADGLSLRDYADKYHVSPETARSQLKSIFAKTGTHRQSRLLRLIYASVAP